jgi:tetratricopeptide (TPR) repeat protein
MPRLLSRISTKLWISGALAMLCACSPWLALAQSSSLDEARRLLREGQIDQALVVIEKRLAADSSDRHSQFLKGVALAEKANISAAIEVFVQLTRDHPQLPEPYNTLAVLYASKHDYERARDSLLQAINTHPSYATAHENLGDIYAKMASLAYTRALSLDTSNIAAKGKLALIDDLFSAPPTAVAVAPPVASPLVPPIVPRAPVVTRTPPPVVSSPANPAATIPAAVVEVSVDGVLDALQGWARAWASQDIERYLHHYVAAKSPDASLSRQRWEQRRRIRLSKPSKVEVDVDNVQIRREGPAQVVVTFVQSYRSESYADKVRKRLVMQNLENRWKISDERTLAKL